MFGNQMKAFIPELGSKLKLEKDWEFDLFLEHRNSDVFLADGRRESGWNVELESYRRMLPANSEFIVDRIYIRNGNKEYSSVTLFIINTVDKNITKNGSRPQPFKSKGEKHYGRFWVKLTDFNSANFTIVTDSTIKTTAAPKLGEAATISTIKRRSYSQQYWVKFVHENPELSFDGLLNACKLSDSISRDSCLEWAWPVSVESYQDSCGGLSYRYKPDFFFATLIPDSWKESRKDIQQYQVQKKSAYAHVWREANIPDVTVTEHPLENQINIPTDKVKRIQLGLETDKTKLENLLVAGGKLSIYNVS